MTANKKNIKIKEKSRFNERTIKLILVGLLVLLFPVLGFFIYREFISNQNQELPLIQGSLESKNSVLGVLFCREDIVTFENFTAQKTWFLLGHEFEGEQDLNLQLSLVAKDSQILTRDETIVNYRIISNSGNRSEGFFEKSDDISNEDILEFNAKIDTSTLPADEYLAYAIVDYGCGEIISSAYKFYVSYPVYVTWTFDWEGSDIPQKNLDSMDSIAKKHRDFPMTHFFNPRIYVYSGMNETRRNYLTQWVINRRDNNGHSIGLHLHMFPDMVAAAGVEPQYEPAWGWHRTDGYDILVSGYSYDKMTRILNWSKNQFVQRGLGTPTTFRAGGWFADEGTLKALQDTGFVIDSSGRNAYSLGTSNVQTHWNLNTKTQPYKPNVYDQNSSIAPNMNIWEFPNNGGSGYTESIDELYSAFTANYAGKPVNVRKVVTYLSHPDWFEVDGPKFDVVFSRIEQNMYEDDKGPVIYANLDQLYLIWKDL